MKFIRSIFAMLFTVVLVFACSDNITEDDYEDTPIMITEIMYNIDNENKCQFIELKNVLSKSISMDGFSIDGGISYDFSNGSITLAPQEFLILTNDKDAFKLLYPEVTPFDEFKGSLSTKGDNIILYSPYKEIVTEVSFETSSPWPILANGYYRSLVPVVVNSLENQNSVSEWRASSLDGGSPMANDPTQISYNVIVNEYAPSDSSSSDGFIELYNTSKTDIDISGWYITTDKDTLNMFVVPENSTIKSESYFVIGKNDGDVISRDAINYANGKSSVVLTSVKNGTLTGYSSVLETYYCPLGKSYGLHKNLAGEFSATMLQEKTVGKENSLFKLGEIVVSEIMYHPAEGGYEFIVLQNRTSQAITLSTDVSANVNSWSVKGISFDFTGNTVIDGDSKLVLFNGDSTDVTTFRETMKIDPSISVFAYSGKLSNSSETIEILKPEGVIFENDKIKGVYSLSDKVTYGDSGNWPSDADGNGYHLIRKEKDGFGDCYINWEKSTTNEGVPFK